MSSLISPPTATFRLRLKTLLFQVHFPTSSSDISNPVIVDFKMAVAILAALKIADRMIATHLVLLLVLAISSKKG